MSKIYDISFDIDQYYETQKKNILVRKTGYKI